MTDIDYLYKYRSISGKEIEWVEETIKNSTIRFGSVAEFNDPFDSAPIYELSGTENQVRRHLNELLKKNSPNLPRHQRRKITRKVCSPTESKEYIRNVGVDMRRIVENFGLYCLSETPDHILMWAHYADSHKGVCFKFKSATTPFLVEHRKFCIPKKRPIVDRLNNSEDELSTNALLTKADYWSYEQEWRIVDYSSKPGIRKFPSQLLHGIILGARIDETAEARIRACIASRSQPIDVFRASLDDKEFRLRIARAP